MQSYQSYKHMCIIQTTTHTIYEEATTGNMIQNGWQIRCNVTVNDLRLRDPSTFSQKKSDIQLLTVFYNKHVSYKAVRFTSSGGTIISSCHMRESLSQFNITRKNRPAAIIIFCSAQIQIYRRLNKTRSSAVAEGPRDVRVIWKCGDIVFRIVYLHRRIKHWHIWPWHAPFARYLPLNYTVTLKLEFGVTQGHWKLNHYIGRPRKPHTRTKHHVDRQSDCEVMAIFVYPRWLSAAILDFIEPKIAPFDPPTPKNLA